MEVIYERITGTDICQEPLTFRASTPGAVTKYHGETRTFKTTTGTLTLLVKSS